MADVAHVIGQDLQIDATGDLAVVVGDDETRQRILHRLLTSASTYIWQLSYGGGLPRLVGSVASQQQIAAIIRAQMGYEASVARTPEPQIVVTGGSLGAVTATVTYTDAISGNTQVLSLPFGG